MASDVPDLYPTEPRCVRLMNTIWSDRAGLHDSLSTVAQLQTWARQVGLDGAARIDRSGLDRARAVRDALRRLAAVAVDDERPGAVSADVDPAEALAVLNDVIAPCSVELRADGPLARGYRSTVSGFDHQLALIGLEAVDLLTGQSEGTLKACGGPGCVLYFVRQHTRREWCSPGCGNRARVARHYRKTKAALA